jgi:ribosomal-protein-alanine acetyltransferase
LLIRPATPADLPALLALERESATAAHWSQPQYQTLFDSNPPRVLLVLEEESSVQAFLAARKVADEFELETIVVSLPARRRGAGTTLLRAFLDVARRSDVTAVFLEVRESSAPARALYDKFKCQQTGRRPRYYRDPEEDAIIYRLDLR